MKRFIDLFRNSKIAWTMVAVPTSIALTGAILRITTLWWIGTALQLSLAVALIIAIRKVKKEVKI